MARITTFSSDKEPLSKLVDKVQEGGIQLPEFQREWVWEDDRIKSLLASVSLSYPIGTLMLLETGNPDGKFKVGHSLEPPLPMTLRSGSSSMASNG